MPNYLVAPSLPIISYCPHVQAMAEDDVDFRSLLHKENGLDTTRGKENLVPPGPGKMGVSVGGGAAEGGVGLQDSAPLLGSGGGGAESAVIVAGGGRWDKSLGVLCQKFIMLFLITPVR